MKRLAPLLLFSIGCLQPQAGVGPHEHDSQHEHDTPEPAPIIVRVGYAEFRGEAAGDLSLASNFVYATNAGTARGHAPVHLPINTTITRFICFGRAPVATTRVTTTLYMLGTQADVLMATATLSDGGGGIDSFQDDAMAVTGVIDHRDYAIELDLDNTGAAVTETFVRSCRIDLSVDP